MANNKNIFKSLFLNAKTRMIVVTLVIVAVVVGVVFVWHQQHRTKIISQASAQVMSAPNITSVPGAGNPSNQYVKNQNLQNSKQEASARKNATSAVPTITRPGFIGNPNAFGELPKKNSTSATKSANACPLKKVVVMFKPNPKSCTVANLKIARQTGVTAEELACQGCSCPSLKLAGYTAGDLKDVGYTATQLHKCGFTLGQLVEAGFSAADLKKAGFNAKQLADVGFTPAQLAIAGFSPAQIKKAGFNAKQ